MPPTRDELRRRKSSPLCGGIAHEHGLDVSSLPIQGTGDSGRVTKKDILAFIESGRASGELGGAASAGSGGPAASAKASAGDFKAAPCRVQAR